MRLLVLTEDFYPSISGGALVKWRFCQLAAERGHDVTVFTPRVADTPERTERDGVCIVRPCRAKPDSLPPQAALGFPFRLAFSVVLCLYLLVYTSRTDYDAVYTGSNTLHWVGAAICRLRGLQGVSFVGYTPGMDPMGGGRLKQFLERLTFRYAMSPVVFCRTPAVRETISAAADRRVEVIHGIVNSEEVRTAAATTDREATRGAYAGDNEVLLAFIGRLSELKNVAAAVDAVADLPAAYRLVIVGDGPQRSAVEARIRARGVEGRVEFVGKLPHEDALAVLAAADALILPSRVEAYPTVVFEGLALGCEVFARPVGILPEIDHPRLHLQPVAEFARAIEATSFDGKGGVDEEMLKSYSLERYTDTVLCAIREDSDK